MDGGSPCPEDGDFFDARPDAEDTEEAINKFLEGLESQEEAGFDRLHSLLENLLGGLSVEKTGAKKAAAQKERLLRGAETRRRRKADRE